VFIHCAPTLRCPLLTRLLRLLSSTDVGIDGRVRGGEGMDSLDSAVGRDASLGTAEVVLGLQLARSDNVVDLID